MPIVYAFDGERLFTPIDAKPKRVGPRRLQRVRNIQANPHVAVIVDQYSDDWRKLAWVQVRGRALLVESGGEYATGIALLEARYPQYAEMPLAGRPLIVIQVEAITRLLNGCLLLTGLTPAAAARCLQAQYIVFFQPARKLAR